MTLRHARIFIGVALLVGLAACDKSTSAPAVPRKAVDSSGTGVESSLTGLSDEEESIEEMADENDPASENDFAAEPAVSESVRPSLSLLSKRAMSKLAPLRAKALSVLQRQNFGSTAVDGAAEAEGDQPVQKLQSIATVVLMICARLFISLVLVWLQRRKGGVGDDASASEGLGTGLLGTICAAVQSGWTKVAALARSPNAAPVMLTLLIVVTKLFKQMDPAQQVDEAHAEEAADVEVETAQPEAAQDGSDLSAAAEESSESDTIECSDRDTVEVDEPAENESAEESAEQ